MRLKKILLIVVMSFVAVLPFFAQKKNAALFPLSTNVSDEDWGRRDAQGIRSALNQALSNQSVLDMRTSELDILLEEKEFQGLTIVQQVKEAGSRIEGLHYLIVGQLQWLGSGYTLSIQILDLKGMEKATATAYNIQRESQDSFIKGAEDISGKLFAAPKPPKNTLTIEQDKNDVVAWWDEAQDKPKFLGELEYKLVYTTNERYLKSISLANTNRNVKIGQDWACEIDANFKVPDEKTTYYYTVLVRNPLGLMAMYEVKKSSGEVVQQATSTTASSTANSSTTTSSTQNIKPDFKLVEGGTFQMGSTSGEGYEKPVHSVTVSSFYICDHEVTQKEYREVMGTNPSYYKGDSRPVEQVTWFNAIEYCNALSRKEGLTPCYTQSGGTWTCNFNADGYRLPTEAEWEYAARGGKKSNGYTYSGSNNIDSVAWYTSTTNDTGTRDVKTKSPNELELYDMSGNVREWCWDWFGSYSSSSQTNPIGASSGSNRVMRGGGWSANASYCRVAFRNGRSPDYRYRSLGFRVVRSANK